MTQTVSPSTFPFLNCLFLFRLHIFPLTFINKHPCIFFMVNRQLLKGYKKLYACGVNLGFTSSIFKKINGLLVKSLWSDYVFLDRHKMFLDADDSMRLSTRGYYEPF